MINKGYGSRPRLKTTLPTEITGEMAKSAIREIASTTLICVLDRESKSFLRGLLKQRAKIKATKKIGAKRANPSCDPYGSPRSGKTKDRFSSEDSGDSKLNVNIPNPLDVASEGDLGK